jgi:hypothetical protein
LWISEPWWANQGGPGSVFANIVDLNGGTHALITPANVLTTNRFHHVAVTYNRASGLGLLYVDGAVRFAANLGSFTPRTSYDLFLGLRPIGSEYPSIYRGLLDEVSLYGRALGTNEIQAIFAARGGKCIVPVAPHLTSHPSGRTNMAGSAATFSVVATGTAPLLYQWRHEGTNLVGQTAASLTVPNVQADAAGNYSVVVSNSVGYAISSNALLTPTAISI